MTTHPIRVGVTVPPAHTTYEEFIQAVRQAEELGVDSIWTWDHLLPSYGDPKGTNFEAWTLLSAMAATTTRAQIGSLVSCNDFRNPGLLASMAKTVDHISAGRFILGIGSGGWPEEHYREFGFAFGTTASRMAALEDALATILHRWEVDAPRPVRYPIPILIGGQGEKKTLRLVAKYASMWHGFGNSTELSHKIEVLDSWCRTVGRDPNEIERCTATTADDTDEIRYGYVQAGVTHLILKRAGPPEAVQQLVRWRDQHCLQEHPFRKPVSQ
jgi:probable F420-dependent oxidoreductase